MTAQKWSAVLSATSAVSVLVATYWAWFGVAFGGKMIMRRWVKFGLLPAMIALQVTALLLALTSD